MTIIIVAFHLLLIIGIVLMVQAMGEKKKLKALALAANKTEEKKLETLSAVPTEPVSEQKQAVQMVHQGLENVVKHLTSFEGHRPEMALAEISAASKSTTDSTGVKHCSNCDAPWDDAFNFCLKCSQAAVSS